MSATPHTSHNFKPAAIASLPSRLRRTKRKCYARRIMLCLCDNGRCRFLGISLSKAEFRAAYLLPIAWMASLVPVFGSGLTRAEINNAGALAPCLLAADQPARLRSFEEARPYAAQSAVPAPASGGTWRLV